MGGGELIAASCSNSSGGGGITPTPTPTTYTITVDGGKAINSAGTGVTSAAQGDTITIVANAPESGKAFDKWTTSTSGVTFAIENATTTTFTMPASAVSVTATYKDLPPSTYSIAVDGGVARNSAGTVVTSATVGDAITIVANDPASGKAFDKWTTSTTGLTFASETSSTTTFTMPESAVSVTATYTTAFTVTFDTDGGSEVAAQTVKEGSKATKPANPTKAVVNGISVAFAGWYSDSAKTTRFNFDTTINATTTVYAKWHEGFRSVPAKNFDGTAITTPTSGVFIQDRVSGNGMSFPAIYACDHEITQCEYETYCKYGGTAPSDEKGKGSNYPAYNVSWYDAIVYCNLKSVADGLTPVYKLNSSTDVTGWIGVDSTGTKYCGPATDTAAWNSIAFDTAANGWRLPTEAEWEMLARGGNLTNSNQTKYSGSDTISDVAWYFENSGDNGGSNNRKSHEVRGKKKNDINLYDMTGNVWEWCWDWYAETSPSITSSTPFSGSATGTCRVMRGGSWGSHDDDCAVGSRGAHDQYARGNIGFRIVRNAE